ncbi:MAG: hypothetical protein LBI14_10380 [Treponema sp.]|jgi:hypothetical protein|nr:hypothetical protein [Treponema sp.]
MNCFYHPEEESVASCVDCGKALCRACAAKYKVAICDECNLKRNTADKAIAIKNFIPSFLFFIGGFIVMFLLSSSESIPYGIVMGILGGWILGGAIWGLIHTRSWFRPKTANVNPFTSTNTGGGLNANSFFKSFGSIAWIFVSVFVGPFLLISGLIKLIIALVKAKKVTDTVNANRAEKE